MLGICPFRSVHQFSGKIWYTLLSKVTTILNHAAFSWGGLGLPTSTRATPSKLTPCKCKSYNGTSSHQTQMDFAIAAWISVHWNTRNEKQISQDRWWTLTLWRPLGPSSRGSPPWWIVWIVPVTVERRTQSQLQTQTHSGQLGKYCNKTVLNQVRF